MSITMPNSQPCLELAKLFMDVKNVTAIRIDIEPNNVVTATIKSLVTVDQMTELVTKIKSYELKDKK